MMRIGGRYIPMKKFHIVSICWIAIAFVLLGAGFYAYFSSNNDIVRFSRILGIAMLKHS